MKKNILYSLSIIGLFALTSCETQTVVMNREVDTLNDGKMLLGVQSVSQLKNAPYSEWYHTEYKQYTPKADILAQLKKEKLNSYQIKVFMGTWCSDSHREVPRLIKILEMEGYPMDRIILVGVNRKKESPSGEESLYNIQRVPTIIFSKYGKEVGRIIETPKSASLEEDMLKIISSRSHSLKDLF